MSVHQEVYAEKLEELTQKLEDVKYATAKARYNKGKVQTITLDHISTLVQTIDALTAIKETIEETTKSN